MALAEKRLHAKAKTAPFVLIRTNIAIRETHGWSNLSHSHTLFFGAKN